MSRQKKKTLIKVGDTVTVLNPGAINWYPQVVGYNGPYFKVKEVIGSLVSLDRPIWGEQYREAQYADHIFKKVNHVNTKLGRILYK